MKKISFKAQAITGLVIMAACITLSEVLQNDVFQNIAWISVGIMFLVNPVWPKSWDYADHKKMKKGAAIAGALMIAFGLITKFGG